MDRCEISKWDIRIKVSGQRSNSLGDGSICDRFIASVLTVDILQTER